MKKVCFGVDVGGTAVKMGLVDEEGTLVKDVKFPSPKNPDQMFDEIAGQIAKMLKAFPGVQCVGIGVGVPGPVPDRAHVHGCVNLGWGVVNVAEGLSRRTGLPVLVENDANLAAFGEMWQGAGRGHRHLVMLTVGTGIGGGVIADGRIVSGAVGAGGEVGHMPMPWHQDWLCTCGKRGCLEVTASATGIIRAAREFPPFSQRERVTAKDVFDAAREGNADAQRVVTEAAHCLGTAAAIIACVVNPELFIIGGGVSAPGELLLAPVREAYRQLAFPPSRDTVFDLAILGNRAGIYGGAGLFFCQA